MPNHDEIYRSEADQYDEMIARQPNLLQVVSEIRAVDGLDVVDMGAGTGRLTTVLAPKVKSIVAVDASEAMLKLTSDRLREAGHTNWGVLVGDHRQLPLEDNCADLVVSGWSICYVSSTAHKDWQSNLERVIGEMRRVLKVGGTAIILETMGTGFETPHPPDFLKDYYAELTDVYGFDHKWIRTDYSFESVEQAERLTRFFFGDDLGDRVARDRIITLPECAGIWWRTFD
ncbi:class I SAM-dependent methyltransferase [Paenibacillus sp. GSMTC-2017]|uniref:class I SAM-dependent methyltransferase n=1 Tax=Paenibacillus sp. GSMTC-2017 TaxID=2794350 RepID=UPI0018D71F7C|nr:class I SAM-dependent methyltransferase [Paenibacillus sp. GSMTC-2017]MBH5318638.1 class I SAM-dependent methyltransferase [Paenibacillus sp. GSMTC-2017]